MHIAVARLFTEQGGGLEVLSFASGLSARSTFPSWVPDWRHEDSGGVPSSSFGTLDVFAGQYKVAAATRPIIMPSHSIRKLTLKRLCTDSVERTMDIDSLRIDNLRTSAESFEECAVSAGIPSSYLHGEPLRKNTMLPY